MLIMQLGALATDAAQRGDDRAADTLQAAAALLFEDKEAVEKVDRRRRRDREARPVANPRIPRTGPNPPKSSESAEIVGGSQGFSPTPPFPNSPTQHESHRAPIDAVEAEYAAAVEGLTGMVSDRMGTLWPDVDAFVRRREYRTWKAWLKEVLTSLTGGQAEPEDVASVCRDDEALTRSIGSPKGFRIFVASAAKERVHPRPNDTHQKPRGGVAMRTFANGRDALRDLP
jgi:hypothetical protein